MPIKNGTVLKERVLTMPTPPSKNMLALEIVTESLLNSIKEFRANENDPSFDRKFSLKTIYFTIEMMHNAIAFQEEFSEIKRKEEKFKRQGN